MKDKELSITALECLLGVEVMMTYLEELEDTKYNRGMLKNKANLFKKELLKHQNKDFPHLIDLDQDLFSELMSTKQSYMDTMVELIATANYPAQCHLLAFNSFDEESRLAALEFLQKRQELLSNVKNENDETKR